MPCKGSSPHAASSDNVASAASSKRPNGNEESVILCNDVPARSLVP